MSAWRWEWWLVVVVSIWWFQFDADSQAEAEYCVFFGSACSYPVQHSRISKPNVSRLETWVLMIWNDSLGLRRLRSHLAMHDRDLSWFIGSPPAFDTWPQRHSDRLWPGYEQSGSGEAETIYIYIIKKQNFPENFSHSTSPLFIWGKNWIKTLKALNWLEISWNKKRSWNTSKISRGFQKVNGTPNATKTSTTRAMQLRMWPRSRGNNPPRTTAKLSGRTDLSQHTGVYPVHPYPWCIQTPHCP